MILSESLKTTRAERKIKELAKMLFPKDNTDVIIYEDSFTIFIPSHTRLRLYHNGHIDFASTLLDGFNVGILMQWINNNNITFE